MTDVIDETHQARRRQRSSRSRCSRGRSLGGVLAESPVRRIDGRRVAAGDLGERALRDRPGRRAGDGREARGGSSASSPGNRRRARVARSRLPGSLARDGRRVVPAALCGRRSEAALAARRDDPAATLGLGNLALIRHDFRTALVTRPRGAGGSRRTRPGRSASSATRWSSSAATGGVRELRPDGRRSSRTWPRTPASPTRASSRGDRAGAIAAMQLALDAAGGQPEATAWTARRARQARARRRPGRGGRQARPALRSRSPRLRPRARAACPGRGRARAARARRRDRPARPPTACRCRSSSASSATCSSARAAMPRRGGSRPTVGGDRPAARRSRRPRRPRVRGLPRRPSDPRRRDRRARTAGARRPTVDPRRRCPRLGARARRVAATRRSTWSQSARSGSARGRARSASTAATRRGAPATGRCARGTARRSRSTRASRSAWPPSRGRPLS